MFRIEVSIFEVLGTGLYVCELCGESKDNHNGRPHEYIPVEVLRDELMTKVGATAAGGSFKLALDPIQVRLNELWNKVTEMSDMLSEETLPVAAGSTDEG